MMGKDQYTYIIYVDSGGTFTDTIVVKPDGTFGSGKSPSTPHDLMECFFKSIDNAGTNLGAKGEDLVSQATIIGYGTTVGTNIMVTRTGGPKIGFITTLGHEDRTIIMRYRAAGLLPVDGMHMVTADKPEPIVPRTLIRGVPERVDRNGAIIMPLDEDGVRKVVRQLLEKGVEAIAVGFLWSFLNDSHEKRTREIINEVAPDIPVSISSEVAPIIREYPRFVSTMIDQYIGLPMRVLLTNMTNKLIKTGYRYPLMVMQAYGGLSRAEIVKPATTLHSGPVGGLIGVEFFKRLYGFEGAVGSDIGGTSFDVALSPKKGGEFLREPLVGRFEIANPMREIVTIGAGGGTIAWIDQATKGLRIGPRSAGAAPGPVCYDAGGTEPTVTDADLVMNRIDPDFFLGGRIKLNREKAVAAIKEKIGDPLDMDIYRAAEAICEIVDGTMQATLSTTLSVKAIDPRETMLLAYGGAGPTHCAGYIAEMAFKKVVIPPFAAVFSAFGASTSNIKHRYELSPLIEFREIAYNPVTLRFDTDKLDMEKYAPVIEKFNDFMEKLERKSLVDMDAEGFKKEDLELSYQFHARYIGQLWELMTISPVGRIDGPDDLKAIIRAFEDQYNKIYGEGAMVPRGGFEIISLILDTSASTPQPVIQKKEFVGEDPSSALKGEREVYFSGRFISSKIYDMPRLQVGNVVEGPAIIETLATTVVVPESRKIRVDEFSNLLMELRN